MVEKFFANSSPAMGNVAVPFVGGLVVLVAVVSVFVLVDVVKAFFRRQETNEHMRRRRANSRRIYRKQVHLVQSLAEMTRKMEMTNAATSGNTLGNCV